MTGLLGFGARPRAQAVMRVSTLLDEDPAANIAAQVLHEAYKRAGLQLEVIHMPGERSLLSANNGQTDGELYRKAGLETAYPNLLMVPVALMRYEIVAFSKRSDINLQGWDSLRPYRFDFIKGIKIIEDNTVGMRFETVASMRQAFSKLMLDRCDLVLMNRISGLATLRALKLEGIHPLSPPLASFPVYHYLHKSHADLLPRLSKILRELEQEKFMQRVQDEVQSKAE
ncbi:ABC transporter substrate-binding protein [Paucibacter sp. AS339]|uniref:substrate-binding periplasmic protein n=1 Tax=Paucibacter hankyongi TaxID=3133434 RepID=UPI0030984B51